MQIKGAKYYISLASLAFSFLGFGCSSPPVKIDLAGVMPQETTPSKSIPELTPSLDLTSFLSSHQQEIKQKNNSNNYNVLGAPIDSTHDNLPSIRLPEKDLEEKLETVAQRQQKTNIFSDVFYDPDAPEIRITGKNDVDKNITSLLYSNKENGALLKRLERARLLYDGEQNSHREDVDVRVSFTVRDVVGIAELVSIIDEKGRAGEISRGVVEGRNSLYKIRDVIKVPIDNFVKSGRDKIFESLVSSDVLTQSAADYVRSFELNPRFVPGTDMYGISLDRQATVENKTSIISLGYMTNSSGNFGRNGDSLFLFQYSISF